LQVQDRLAYLIQQVASNTATVDELQELSDLVKTDQAGNISRQIETMLLEGMPPDNTTYDTTYWDNVADKILAVDHAPADRPVKLYKWMAVAAAVALLIISAGAYLLLQPHKQPLPIADVRQPVITPGGNRAVLVLADGTQIPLDSAVNGALAQQGNTQIIKPDSGHLTYTHNGGTPNAEVQYNTLRTPRGGQFQLQLPDGTKVWLNAASSLKYPTAFTGKERNVELTGEAYFEVAHSSTLPFRVNINTGRMKVDVLGTRFNIMAYEEEELVKTTLLEGAVKVTGDGNGKRLEPGQGASLNKRNGTMEVLDHVNMEEAVAWKNGSFQFEGNDIQSVMRQIARWYDVDVVYKAPVPAHFRGIIPRNAQVSQLLHTLELTGEVHFEIRGKQIIVSP
jgi:ferric-dicitrate binding protein FerR (iron transport regulator)